MTAIGDDVSWGSGQDNLSPDFDHGGNNMGFDYGKYDMSPIVPNNPLGEGIFPYARPSVTTKQRSNSGDFISWNTSALGFKPSSGADMSSMSSLPNGNFVFQQPQLQPQPSGLMMQETKLSGNTKMLVSSRSPDTSMPTLEMPSTGTIFNPMQSMQMQMQMPMQGTGSGLGSVGSPPENYTFTVKPYQMEQLNAAMSQQATTSNNSHLSSNFGLTSSASSSDHMNTNNGSNSMFGTSPNINDGNMMKPTVSGSPSNSTAMGISPPNNGSMLTSQHTSSKSRSGVSVAVHNANANAAAAVPVPPRTLTEARDSKQRGMPTAPLKNAPASTVIASPYYKPPKTRPAASNSPPSDSGTRRSGRKTKAKPEEGSEKGTKRPASPPLTAQDKKRNRLARKAALARESRQRKKAYVSTLEEQVTSLSAQIAELELKHGIKKAPSSSNNNSSEPNAMDLLPERRSLRSGLRSRYSSSSPSLSTLDKQKMQDTKEQIQRQQEQERLQAEAVDLNAIQQAATTAMTQIEQSLYPGVEGQFARWLVAQPDNNIAGLISLAKDLGLNSDQVEALKKQREVMIGCHNQLEETAKLLKDTRSDVFAHLHGLKPLVQGLQDVMSPKQFSKFCAWASNEMVATMLNNAWADKRLQ